MWLCCAGGSWSINQTLFQLATVLSDSRAELCRVTGAAPKSVMSSTGSMHPVISGFKKRAALYVSSLDQVTWLHYGFGPVQFNFININVSLSTSHEFFTYTEWSESIMWRSHLCINMFCLQTYVTCFYDIWYWDLHEKLSSKVNFSLYLPTVTHTLHKPQIIFSSFLRN
jgi:hypothetical protein